MRCARKIGFALILWVCFTAGCLIAPIVAILLLIPAVWKTDYIRNFVKAADRLCAAELGFSGRVMLSTELVYSSRLQWMRKGLDECEPDHCLKSVYVESPYCRLSDNQIRCK